MQQFSTDNSPVELQLISGHLLFADPLYFQDIVEGYSQADPDPLAGPKEFMKQLEETLFPYGGGVLLGYRFVGSQDDIYLLDPICLKRLDENNAEQELLAEQKQITTFGVDTASFLILDLANYKKLIQHISYNSLIDALLGNQLDKYFERINKDLGNKGWAYVVSEGVNTSSEFDGDGLYVLD